jgi:hypothetical protein
MSTAAVLQYGSYVALELKGQPDANVFVHWQLLVLIPTLVHRHLLETQARFQGWQPGAGEWSITYIELCDPTTPQVAVLHTDPEEISQLVQARVPLWPSVYEFDLGYHCTQPLDDSLFPALQHVAYFRLTTGNEDPVPATPPTLVL